ncbi:MAG: S-layer homology domain-containing protein [Anaerovoracaceae bacterium]
MKRIFTFIVLGVMTLTMIPMSGISAFAESLPTGDSFEAPQNLTVELKEWEDGRPYFALKWLNPRSIWELGQYGVEHGQWGAEYQIDIKVGDGQWRYDRGESISGNALNFDEELDKPGNYVTDDVTCDPMDFGADGAIDIKANQYQIRVRYAYIANQGGDDYYIYSPFSNVASIGTKSFYKDASNWAISDLQKANDLGLIPNILKGADMTKPITREEFAELSVVLYEKATGEKSEPFSPNPFTDTTNIQILKAFDLKITAGTSETTFSPNVLINREQCAAMLFRAIKAIEPQGDYSITGVKDFPDQKSISSYAVEATKYMSKIGVISGDAQGNFMPKATTPAQEAVGYGMATREQAIALSVRTYDKAPGI